MHFFLYTFVNVINGTYERLLSLLNIITSIIF